MKEEKKFKVVLDTNIFVSSTFWQGDPHKIIKLAIDKIIEIYISPEILNELEKVLKRDFKEDKEFIDRQTALILEYGNLVRPINKLNIVKEDPDDNKIIECAFTAKADFIITNDNHLLKLKEALEIKIIKPKEFLELLN